MPHPLFHLLHLSDPNLPIGGFSHSSGLETYVQNGLVTDEKIGANIYPGNVAKNLFYNDAMYLSVAYQACVADELSYIKKLDLHCNATKLSKEIRIASQKLGVRLLKIFDEICSSTLFSQYSKWVKQQNAFGHYCIAFAVIAHDLKINLKDSLTGFYYNAASGFVTNCVKLIPLGQQTGQKILFELIPLIEELVTAGLTPSADQLGLCSVGFDLRAMQHENLYSRLYMS